MNKRSLWIASLSGAVLTTLFSNMPLIGIVNCVVCAWFWAGGAFAVWLYRRLSNDMPTMRQGLTVGALTGLLAGILGFSLSFAGISGLQGMMQGLPADATSGMEDIPIWGVIIFNLMGVVFNIIFGTLGGWLAVTIFNRTRKPVTA
ncbi:MAG: hypothetical protein ACM3XO_22490 [Bacteroidota bacterium]